MLPRWALSVYEVPCTLCAYDCDPDMPIQFFSLAYPCPTVHMFHYETKKSNITFRAVSVFHFSKNSGTLTEGALFQRSRHCRSHLRSSYDFSLMTAQLFLKLMIFFYDATRPSFLIKQE